MDKVMKKKVFKVVDLKVQDGFTLLEIIIAIGILSFGLLAVASMQTTSIKANTSALGLTGAMALAEDRVERLVAMPYRDATTDDIVAELKDGAGATAGVAGLNNNPYHPTSPQNADWSDPSNPIQIGGEGFQYNVFCNSANDYPIDNTTTVRVTVAWQERGSWRTASVDYMKLDPFNE
jgi:type IV pilus modification protein PilV